MARRQSRIDVADRRGWQRGNARIDRPDQPQFNQDPRRRSEIVAHGANRRGATLADRWLAGRLATIDHLRDVALRNENPNLLEKADQLEAHARQQYLWKTGQIEHPQAPPPTSARFDPALPPEMEDDGTGSGTGFDESDTPPPETSPTLEGSGEASSFQSQQSSGLPRVFDPRGRGRTPTDIRRLPPAR